MSDKNKIHYYNRSAGKMEVELVYGDAAIKFIYANPVGGVFGKLISSRPISQVYGGMQSSSLSKLKVPGFCKKFGIDLSEYQAGSVNSSSKDTSYKSFNEFFIRKFEPGKREFISSENQMPAFCEARYFGHEEITDDTRIPVKGRFLRAKDLIANDKWDSCFEGGPFLVARLCPVDYHRYHYPLSGQTLDSYPVKGEFHSVNPLALKAKEDIFIVNERRVAILETEDFGKLAYIEVGAAMVGRIVQSHDEKVRFRRGDEKGYFLFGGSTVILLGEKGKWKPSADILKNTADGVETYLKLGEEVALKN